MIIIQKKKNLDIKEKKLRPCLKKLIKRYQIFQPHMKKILILFILVEYLHLVTYQNLLIHLNEDNKGTICNVLEFIILKLLIFFSFNRFPRFSNDWPGCS